MLLLCFFFFQAEDGIRDLVRSRGLGDVYKRQQWCTMFASWVANEAGSPLYNEKTKSWRLINSRDFAANLEKNGTWLSLIHI